MIREFLFKHIRQLSIWYLALAVFECMIPLILLLCILPSMENLISLIPNVNETSRSCLNKAIFSYVLTQLIYESAWRMRDWLKLSFSTRVKFNVFKGLIKDIIKFDSIFFKNHDPVMLVHMVKNVSDSSDKILCIYIKLLRYLIFLVLIPIKIYRINSLCGLCLLGWIVLWFTASITLFRYVSNNSATLSGLKNKLLAGFVDTLANVDSVFIYKTYSHEEAKFGRQLQNIMKYDRGLQMAFWYLWVMQGTLLCGITYFILMILSQSSILFASTFVVLCQVINELSDSMWSSAEYILDFAENYGHMRNGLNVFSKNPIRQIGNRNTVNIVSSEKKCITFDNVSFEHNNEVKFTFNCTISKNETVALVGRSGSGKTTFVKLLLGMFDPVSGKITDTITIKDDLNPFAYIPQHIHLFNASIRYNLTYGIKRSITELEIAEALETAQCDFIKNFKGECNAIIDNRQLSGGQIQRLLIARSILMKSKILVFDEPTAALDFKTEIEIMDCIHKIKATKIIITHKLNTVEQADRILVFDRGAIVADGLPEELIDNEYYSSSFKK